MRSKTGKHITYYKRMLYGIYDNNRFSRQIGYVFGLFFSIYGIDWQVMSYKEFAGAELSPLPVVLSYGKEEPEGSFPWHVHIYESRLFSEQYLRPASMPERPLERFNDLPVIYQGSKQIKGHVRCVGRLIETDIDIIASAFFMLTRYEEVVSPIQDRFQRFPATASLAYKEAFLHRPIVNEYIELLWSWIEKFNLGLKRRKLWNGKDFAVCLTHDVDALRKYNWYPPLRAIASWTLKHGKPGRSLAVIKDYSRAKLKGDPYDKFDYLIKLSRQHGFVSTFYFMSGGRTKYDQNYQITDRRTGALMGKIRGNGFEVGLHTSFDAYKAPELLVAEKAKLEEVLGVKVTGCRQHYLRWKTPESWRAREQAGLKYDTSLSFADHEGFRCGICVPFRPFDVIENRELNIWELPLIVMDGSLFTYQGLSPERALNRVRSLIETVETHNGLFVLLWHNSSLDDFERPGWKYVYEEVVEYLSEQNVFSDTCYKIVRYWEDKMRNV